MPSAFDDRFEAIALPVLRREHGQTVTHITAAGVSASVSLAMWDESDPVPNTERGKGVVRTGVLTVPDSLSVAKADRFTIGGVSWAVESLHDNGGGFIDVRCVRHEDEIVSGRQRRTM